VRSTGWSGDSRLVAAHERCSIYKSIVSITLGVIDRYAFRVDVLSQHLTVPGCKTNCMLDQVNPMTAPLV
jgi:hypothetical protein